MKVLLNSRWINVFDNTHARVVRVWFNTSLRCEMVTIVKLNGKDIEMTKESFLKQYRQ